MNPPREPQHGVDLRGASVRTTPAALRASRDAGRPLLASNFQRKSDRSQPRTGARADLGRGAAAQ